MDLNNPEYLQSLLDNIRTNNRGAVKTEKSDQRRNGNMSPDDEVHVEEIVELDDQNRSINEEQFEEEKNVNEDEEYEVEKIINYRIKKQRVELLIKWKGYSMDDNTWEKLNDLKGVTIHDSKYKKWLLRADQALKENIEKRRQEELTKESGQIAGQSCEMSSLSTAEVSSTTSTPFDATSKRKQVSFIEGGNAEPSPKRAGSILKPAKEVQINKRLTCGFCLLAFESNEMVCNHIEEKHSDYKEFNDPDAVVKITPLPDDPTPEFVWKCTICDVRMQRKDEVLRHKLHDHDNIPRVPCDQCDSRFENAATLKNHRREYHFPAKMIESFLQHSTAPKPSPVSAPVVKDPDKPFHCPDCGVGFMHNFSINQHKKTGVCKADQPGFSGSALPSSNTPQCRSCGKTFSRKQTLTRHHLFNRCPATNSNQESTKLFTSAPIVKDPTKPYHCRECGVGFTQIGSLNVHKNKGRCRAVNSSTSPFHCRDCLKGFSSKQNLQRHHLLKRCPVKNGKQASPLKPTTVNSPLSSASPPSGPQVKREQCPDCKVTFCGSGNLARHIRLNRCTAKNAAGRRIEIFTCPGCKTVFNNRMRWGMHRKQCELYQKCQADKSGPKTDSSPSFSSKSVSSFSFSTKPLSLNGTSPQPSLDRIPQKKKRKQCPDCETTFVNSAGLWRHINLNRCRAKKETGRTYTCSCRAVFKHHTQWEMHQKECDVYRRCAGPAASGGKDQSVLKTEISPSTATSSYTSPVKNSSTQPLMTGVLDDDMESIFLYRMRGQCVVCDAMPSDLRHHLLSAHCVPLDKVQRFM